jgi:hypothetical protein
MRSLLLGHQTGHRFATAFIATGAATNILAK